MSTRVSLAELAAADIRLRPAEAVAIVAAICQQHNAGTLRGIPSPGVIRLTRDGDVVAEGPITTAQDEVARAAMLLTDVLSGFDALPEYRASGALRLTIARALGTIDLPPYASLDEFCAALARFAPEDVRDVARGLFSAWERARAGRAFKGADCADLTISDVRRARRATGLSLAYLATVADLPPTRLRDLEWGYMRDWPATPEGRAQVVRYARAAGLDESIVLSIAWPMILERAWDADRSPGVALVRSGPQAMTVVRPVVAVPVRAGRWREAIVAAAATAALIGAFAFGWRSSQPAPPRQDVVQVDGPGDPVIHRAALHTRAEEPHGEVPAAQEPAAGVARAVVMPTAEIRPAVRTSNASGRRAPQRQAVAPRPKPRRTTAPAPQRAEPTKTPFLQRELFRIVIR